MQRHGAAVAVTAERDVEDRLQRALHENIVLKLQKNDLEEKLKKLQTQFRRLVADWRRVQGGSGFSRGSTVLRPCCAPSPWAMEPSARPHSAAEADSRGAPAAPPLEGLLPPLNPNQSSQTACGASSTTAKAWKRQESPPGTTGVAAGASEAELAACKAALAHAQLELQQLRSSALAAIQARATTPLALKNVTTMPADASAAILEASKQEAAQLRSQLQKIREELNASVLAQQQLRVQSNQAMQGMQQQLETQYRASIDTLTREKQELILKVRLAEAEKQAKSSVEASSPDPMEMATLHGEVHRKVSEVALLNSHLQYAQGQVETLKGECNRLIEELKEAHAAHADTKRALFTLEHEAASLRTQCRSMTEVELALQRKTEECSNTEQELLKLVGSLQTCQRETEAAVRLEFQSRLTEVQEMRDTAERERREVERRLLSSQHDLAELRRRLENTQGDLQLYHGEVAKLEKEKSAISAQIALAGHTAAAVAAAGADLTDEDVHRALAVAAIKKRGSRTQKREAEMGLGGAGTVDGDAAAAAGAAPAKEARDALDLFEALAWDGDWEQGQMREALATAAMDLELAQTRCQQMAEQVEQSREMLRKVSDERDTLLEESIALRGRVMHVQTIFAKQQLQAYRAAATASGLGTEGLISFSIRGLQSQEAAMCRSLGIANLKAPVSFFFTLDGLADYEAMMGPTLRALDDVVDVRFQYEGLAKDAVTLATIEETVFCFQLHCAAGETSRLVAMAELPGAALLNAREVPVEDTLPLIDGEGQTVGSILVEFCCARLVLPILLGAPLSDPRAGATTFTLSAQEIKSAMVALRTVCYLRIQVFRAEGLAGSLEGGTAPQPYVFYTATSPLGALNCVRDTVVHPSSRIFTTDPVFDVVPVDHRVIVDPALIRFVAFGVVSFVLFDERATNVQANLGVVEVALRPLLNSPHAIIRVTERLHPQGTLSVGLSWVSGV
ncbi:conserved hypothetical protein [Leishmania braziliensis MHOM/BR/75/M2904]|uniref:RPGR-interacting protein 1 first C2 domain-containing protein n=2 Tax=Leishmania braziliensis TaxID=5660 RepID=A4HH39_LEIBR|nr:conserved hypothetical protein [Leishmania braziliensis MHOM/BR/75/M2904]KAI5684888.1 hypothetical protein MNV84_05495 [Leishmania braziliensis]CAJ2476328.1 unnamed protein product [Leishmania braziliensis]CAM39888.2 conserved hypothetical protein [Leishmania braziliensis MHOM/BR/75/M2904]SYZ67558.1 Domain_of_uncharacterised_function_(DUF3451) [Leishmania braziliensis MHOM/BR/75/M2904]